MGVKNISPVQVCSLSGLRLLCSTMEWQEKKRTSEAKKKNLYAIKIKFRLFTRLAAAKALGRIKPKKAIKPLINALCDWNRFVKAEASGALIKICTKDDKGRMRTLLDSENELAANLAFEILEEIE